MSQVAGIEALNVFGGLACLDVTLLAKHRKLDSARFGNLLMKEKTVALPCEDPVSFAVNAAMPIIERMSASERDSIELLITCTESGIDFGKSMSTYIHKYLGLKRQCRLFEIKQACYSGTAGLQMASSFVLSQVAPGARALVIATDVSRFMAVEGGESLTADWSFAEPSSGAGAVAMLVSGEPHIFQLDAGASGYYGHEIMDTCRPLPDGDTGNADLSLLSYLDCCEQSFLEYQRRVADVHYARSFDYLAFHTPFGGMIKGAHRSMMRKHVRAPLEEIEKDFERRVLPGMRYCQRVGNIMGGTVMMSLAGIIESGDFSAARRIGCFSYGSGCCSEFYSGVATADSQRRLRELNILGRLDDRYAMSIDEYEAILRTSDVVRFGTRNVQLDGFLSDGVRAAHRGTRRLYLSQIAEFHREYAWTA